MKSEKMEMVGKQSFNGEHAAKKTMEAEMEKKVKSAAEKSATQKTEPWHKPKKGSVFPAKRRSVKKMIYDLLFRKNKKKSKHVRSFKRDE